MIALFDNPLFDSFSAGKTAGKAIVYCLGLFFLFLGIAIISDRFMAAIEIITSQVISYDLNKKLST